jgi:hypothetical protein
MRIRSHERQAFIDAKFKVFFFAPKWNQENGFAKSALLLRWWPEIQKKLEASRPGECWELQFQWNVFQLRDVGGTTRSLKGKNQALPAAA